MARKLLSKWLTAAWLFSQLHALENLRRCLELRRATAKSIRPSRGKSTFAAAPAATIRVQCALGFADWPDEDSPQKSQENLSWPVRTFSHIEIAPIFTAESGRPVDALTGLDSNRSGAFPLSSRPLGFGRNSLQTPSIVTMDLRVLKYFPFGGVRRLDLVAESFNFLNRANVAQINPVFGSNLTPVAGFGQATEKLGARRIHFSLDFEF